MKLAIRLGLLMIGLLTASTAMADVTVKLSDVHLCCGACVRGIENAVKDLKSTVSIDKDLGTVTVKAADAAAAQQAVDAIAAAGYHGESDNATTKMKSDSGAPSGNVKRVSVSGVHNCCGGCAKAIVEAVKSVKGAAVGPLAGRATTFVVEGDFSAADLVKSLNGAGFHVKVSTN